MELLFAAVIVVVLLGLAWYYGRRQWRLLKSLRGPTVLPEDERRFYHRQAGRRLLGCALMVGLAGLLSGWYVLGLNRQAEELRAPVAHEGAEELSDQQQRSVSLFGIYWLVAGLVLLALVLLALVDAWAIRRFGLRQLRQLQMDRREMLEQEMAQMRERRRER